MARLDELERKFEENPRRYFAPLANEYRKAGDAQRAADLCRAQLPDIPGHISGHIVLGQSLYDTGDYAGSRAALETALALDPENIVALRYLGDIARETGDAAEASRWYSRTLDADPYNEAATLALQSLQDLVGAHAPAPDAPAEDVPAEEFPATDSVADGFEPTSYVAEPPEKSETLEDFERSETSEAPETSEALGSSATPETFEPEAIEVLETGEPAASAEPSAAPETPPAAEFTGDLEISAPADSAPPEEPSVVEASAVELPAGVMPGDAPPPDVASQPEPVEVAPVEVAPVEAPEERVEPEAETATADEPAALDTASAEVASAEPGTVEEAFLAEERVLESAAPFVTETMADLYMEQGYPHEALELLLQLAQQRPLDDQLRGKIEQIESFIAARRDAAVAAARAERAEITGAAQAAEAGAALETRELTETTQSIEAPESIEATESIEGTESIEAPFDAAVAEVDSSAFVTSDLSDAVLSFDAHPFMAQSHEPITVREMFVRMDKARPRPAGTVTPRPLSRLRSDFAPMPNRAGGGGDASADPFAVPDAPSHPEARPDAVPRSSGPQPTFNPSTAPVEDFDAWLRGLKGP